MPESYCTRYHIHLTFCDYRPLTAILMLTVPVVPFQAFRVWRIDYWNFGFDAAARSLSCSVFGG